MVRRTVFDRMVTDKKVVHKKVYPERKLLGQLVNHKYVTIVSAMLFREIIFYESNGLWAICEKD